MTLGTILLIGAGLLLAGGVMVLCAELLDAIATAAKLGAK